MRPIFILVLISLSACSSTMDGYSPNGTVTTVDGAEFLVRPMRGRPNTYQAMENDPTLGTLMRINALTYARNVKAIEQVTGCKVAVGSIQNRSNNTIAATEC